jgi:nicotinamidase-related amidase
MEALIIIDMTRDNLTGLMGERAEKIIPVINKLTDYFRQKNNLVIFANDSFLKDDFLFKSKMSPHSLRWTDGEKVATSLNVKDTDIVLPKRRFSAFFKTDLDQTLRTFEVEKVYVCGITSIFCVLATAFDSICHDFYTVIIEDATTAHKDEVHEQVMNFYRKNPLQPLFEIKKSNEIIT